MAGNDSTPDEELEEALRLSMIVDDNTTSGTGSQSNSTTEVGGTQSRSTASPEEFVKMLALCLATAMQQPLSPPFSQEPAPADQSGTEFPLQPTSLIELDQKKKAPTHKINQQYPRREPSYSPSPEDRGGRAREKKPRQT